MASGAPRCASAVCPLLGFSSLTDAFLTYTAAPAECVSCLTPLCSHTGAARAGVVNMTKTLAVEWADKGVRVNSVAPGVIFSQTAAANYDDPTILSAYAPVVPSKRLGTVEEVSAAVVYLLSPAAAYTTGHTLCVDGGSSLVGKPFPVAPHGHNPPFGDLPETCISKL